MTTAPEILEGSLYRELLGPQWAELAPALQRAHGQGEILESAGRFDITHGHGWLARWLAHRGGLPPAGRDVPTRLRVQRGQHAEYWQRSFGGFPLPSVQFARSSGVLAERFGFIEIRFTLEVCSGGICYRQRGAALHVLCWWLPLPKWLGPEILAQEMPGKTPQRTSVHVTVRVPLVGVVLDYLGYMEMQETAP